VRAEPRVDQRTIADRVQLRDRDVDDIAVLVQPGAAVPKGAPLLILEAMKMEHTITAPAAGTVSAVHYRPGEQVAEGAALIDLDGDATTPAA